jgi:lysophospholipase L1-like esterase
MPIKIFIAGNELNTTSVVPVIDTPLERFRNKKLIVTGDSITAGYGGGPTWQSHLKSWLYLSAVYNDAVTATGVSKNVGADKCIYERIDDTAPKGWDALYTPTPNYILVMVSMNDIGFNALPLGTTADITSVNPAFHTSYYMNIRMLIEKLHTKYPLVPLGIITPIPWSTHYGRADTYYTWNQAVKDVCMHYSVPCLDLFTSSDFRPWNATWCSTYQPDGTHPNAAGQQIIAYKLYEFCKQYL